MSANAAVLAALLLCAAIPAISQAPGECWSKCCARSTQPDHKQRSPSGTCALVLFPHSHQKSLYACLASNYGAPAAGNSEGPAPVRTAGSGEGGPAARLPAGGVPEAFPPGPPGAPPRPPLNGPFPPPIPLAPYASQLNIRLPETYLVLTQGFRCDLSAGFVPRTAACIVVWPASKQTHTSAQVLWPSFVQGASMALQESKPGHDFSCSRLGMRPCKGCCIVRGRL